MAFAGFRPLKRFSSNRKSVRSRGVSLIEFTLVLPLMLLLAYGLIDAVIFIRQIQVVQDAVQEATFTAAKLNGVPIEHRGYIAANNFENYLKAHDPAAPVQHEVSRFLDEVQFGTDFRQWTVSVSYPFLSTEFDPATGTNVIHQAIKVEAHRRGAGDPGLRGQTPSRSCFVCLSNLFSAIITPPSSIYGFN